LVKNLGLLKEQPTRKQLEGTAAKEGDSDGDEVGELDGASDHVKEHMAGSTVPNFIQMGHDVGLSVNVLEESIEITLAGLSKGAACILANVQ
jgi:hypothetical protein